MDRVSFECASAAIRSAAATVASCSRVRSTWLVVLADGGLRGMDPGTTAAKVTPLRITRIHPPNDGSPAQYLSRICPGRLTPQQVITGNDRSQPDSAKSSLRNGLGPKCGKAKKLRNVASANPPLSLNS